MRNWRRKARWLQRWELLRFDLRRVKARLPVILSRVDGKGPPDRARDRSSGRGSFAVYAAQDDRVVVCFPIIEWDFRFQRPQQLMTRFARAGRRVLYVTKRDVPSREKHPGVTEVSINNLEVPENAILIVQHPRWWPLIETLPNRVIYDCMDHIAGFATEVADANERELMAHADLVVVTSDALEKEARKHAKDVVVIRNGCDYEHFARTPRAENERPVIGYYGAISDWFDSALVAELARAKPEWEFLLVGSTRGADLAGLRKLRNVTFTGERAYAELPEWLGVMNVCIIPFKRMPLTEATNPVKVYEMLAAGKPVVSVPIPEVAALAPLVRLASTAEEFAREIHAALDDRDDEARRAFARQQTWDHRFAQWDHRFAQLDAKLRAR